MTSTIVSTLILMCAWSGAPDPSPSSPERVSALLGSCALLPCSFRPLAGRVEVRLSYVSAILRLRQTAFSTDTAERVKGRSWKGRVALAGVLSSGDCSLTIANVTSDDPDTYDIQLKGQGESWGRATSIQLKLSRFPEQPVISDPGALTAGRVTALNCSVRISCPSAAPTLQWVWERGVQEGGRVSGQTERVQTEGQLPTLLSSLSFTPSHQLKPRVKCEALYPDSRRSSVRREMQVHFPPTEVSVEVYTLSVREGGSAMLTCSCKADPPVTEYRWTHTRSGVTETLPSHTHAVRIRNITRDTRVQCSVQNNLGSATSPHTRLNVHYSPAIVLQSSRCVWDGEFVVCVCTVDSNPRPIITWSVNGSVPPDHYNTSSTYTPYTLLETLRGAAHTPPTVTCYAINSLGNDSQTLRGTRQEEGSVLWVLMPAGFGLLLFILLLLLVLLCCWRWRAGSRRRRVLRCGPDVHSDSVGIYQEHMPLYINCTEVTNIYTNGSYQLIYQNSTPCFIRTKQIYKRQRRGARRRTVQDQRETDRHTELSTTDADTGIYVEVI